MLSVNLRETPSRSPGLINPGQRDVYHVVQHLRATYHFHLGIFVIKLHLLLVTFSFNKSAKAVGDSDFFTRRRDYLHLYRYLNFQTLTFQVSKLRCFQILRSYQIFKLRQEGKKLWEVIRVIGGVTRRYAKVPCE